MGDHAKIINLGAGVWGWVRTGVIIGGLVLAWGKLESRLARAEEKVVIAKAEAASVQADVRAIRESIGTIQLDIAQLCAATFSPKECYTSGKGTK